MRVRFVPLLRPRAASPPDRDRVEASRRSSRSGGEVFGRLIAVRRARLGLSQEELAARIDTSQANVARIEEGHSPSTETLKRLAAALDVKPGTGALRRLAVATRVPVIPILGGALSVVVGFGVGFAMDGGLSGAGGGGPSGQSPQAVSAAPAVPPVTTGRAQGKSRKTKRQSATPAVAVSQPSSARAPTKEESQPATIQPASEPVASSPAPSSSGGGSNNPPPQVHSDPPPQVQSDPPPQVDHGIGGGEASHGIVPGGG